MTLTSFYLAITIIFLLIGIVGAVLPVIPGNLLMGIAIFAFAWGDSFQTISIWWTLLLVIISLVGATADIWLPLLGAKGGVASVKSIVFGMVGGVVGFIVGSFVPILGNLIGALLGYFLGIVLAEYSAVRELSQALKAGIGGVVGWGLAAIVQLVIALVVFVSFLVIVF